MVARKVRGWGGSGGRVVVGGGALCDVTNWRDT